MFRIIAFVATILCSTLAAANPVGKLLVLVDGNIWRSGSAVLINSRTGCLTTNRHITVYAQSQRVSLALEIGNGYITRRHEVRVAWEHPGEDLALVCLKNTDGVILPAAARPHRGDTDWYSRHTVRGFPAYNNTRYREAPVYVRARQQERLVEEYHRDAIRLDLRNLGVSNPVIVFSTTGLTTVQTTDWEDREKVYGGFSGGGLFDPQGNLLGVVASGNTQSQIDVIPVEMIPHQFFK